MKEKKLITKRLQVAIIILLTLNLLVMATQAALATRTPTKQLSNSEIMRRANNAVNAADWTEAAIWYAIYIDREPTIPFKDTAYKNKLLDQLEKIKNNASADRLLANDVRADKDYISFINNCYASVNRPVPFSRSAQSNPPAPRSMIDMGPAPDEVWVFQDASFGGVWNILAVGNYINAVQFDLPDNSISSIMVGSRVRAYLCTDQGLNGTCGMFDSHVPFHHPNLANNVTGDNSISSIRVEEEANKCTPGPNEVTLFMHFDYKYPCQTLAVGEYPYPEHFNLPNDGVSSIQVGSNVQAVLCRDINFGGACETIANNDPNLSDNTIGNDQLSSIRITPR